jgi:hypothetical protein
VNAASFALEVGKQARALPPAVMTKFVRALTLEAGTRIIRRTPVDTGRARGSWQTTVDAPATADIDRVDKSGAQAISEAKSTTALLDPTRFQSTYITSNLSYIRVLEFGEFGRGGHAIGPARVKATRVQRFTRARVGLAKLKKLERLGVNPATFVRFRRVKLKKPITIIAKTTPEGFSTQAPRGMVGITVEELRAFANNASFKAQALSGTLPAAEIQQ